MEISILNFIEGAQQARGLTVVIDVFRAFSTACYAVANGATKIIPVGEVEQARQLKSRHPDYVLVGEREGRKLPGFDYNNSPTALETVDLSGCTVVHTTSNGTQGLVNARQASEVITGSFVNAGAIVSYLLTRQPEMVSLVVMGARPGVLATEDSLCAEFLKASLEGRALDFTAITNEIRISEVGQLCFDPAEDWIPERDFELCLALNRFDFILRAERGELDGKELLVLRRVM